MTDFEDLNAEERALVERVRETYRAPDASATQRAAFIERLEQRVTRPARLGWWTPAAVGVAVVALAVWLGVRTPDVAPVPTIADGTGATEALLVLANDTASELDAAMPDDYLAIEALLIGG